MFMYRNLYLIDYLTSHPNTTKGEFAVAWKCCDGATKEVRHVDLPAYMILTKLITQKYQQLSKEETKAWKKGV